MMNKTENVSIGRIGFICEQDAYTLLRQYLDRSAKKLSADPDKTEIIADLESSMAMHLKELSGELVVDYATAEKVIHLMGEVTEGVDIDTEEKNDEQPQAFKDRLNNLFSKPLFKDKQRAIGDGVCAGIARTLQVDPLWVRIVFVALTFLTQGVMIAIYIILSILMSEDKNEEKRTASEVVTSMRDKLAKSVEASRPYERILRKIVVIAAKSVWILLEVVVGAILLAVAVGWASIFFMTDRPELIEVLGGKPGWLEYAFIVSVGLALLIPLYELLSAMIRPRPSRPRTTIVLWSVWLLSIIVATASAANIYPSVSNYVKTNQPRNSFIYVQTVGGDVVDVCFSPLGTCEDTEQILLYQTMCDMDVTVYDREENYIWASRGWTARYTSLKYPATEKDLCTELTSLIKIHGKENLMYASQELNDGSYVSYDKTVYDGTMPNGILQQSDEKYWHMEYMTR